MPARDFRTKTTTMVALQSKPNLAKSNGTEVFFTPLMAKSGGVRWGVEQGSSSRSEEGQEGERRWTVLMGTCYESSHTLQPSNFAPPPPLSSYRYKSWNGTVLRTRRTSKDPQPLCRQCYTVIGLHFLKSPYQRVA